MKIIGRNTKAPDFFYMTGMFKMADKAKWPRKSLYAYFVLKVKLCKSKNLCCVSSDYLHVL